MKRGKNILRTGFTLIEVMLALMVITIGIVSITGLLSSSLNTSSKAHDDITVVSFADLVLNSSHANGFDALPMSGSLPIIEMDGSSRSLPIGRIETYTGEVPSFGIDQTQEYTVSYRISAQEQPGVKMVSLEIWPDRNTSTTPRRFHTEIYNWNKSE